MLYKDNKKDADLQTFKFFNTMSYCNLAGIGEDWQTNMTKSRLEKPEQAGTVRRSRLGHF